MIKQGNLSLPVFEQIKKMIIEGKLKPGEKIKQEQLALELGVSRTPLLKAFQMLENEFLVKSIPRRGIFVYETNLQEINDAFECRRVLEGLATNKAAENITAKGIAELRDIMSPFKGDDTDDLVAYQAADNLFHRKLIELSGNKVLLSMDFFDNILSQTYKKGLIRGSEETFNEHHQIINALEKKDATEAERLAKLHLSKSIEVIKESMIKDNI